MANGVGPDSVQCLHLAGTELGHLLEPDHAARGERTGRGGAEVWQRDARLRFRPGPDRPGMTLVVQHGGTARREPVPDVQRFGQAALLQLAHVLFEGGGVAAHPLREVGCPGGRQFVDQQQRRPGPWPGRRGTVEPVEPRADRVDLRGVGYRLPQRAPWVDAGVPEPDPIHRPVGVQTVQPLPECRQRSRAGPASIRRGQRAHRHAVDGGDLHQSDRGAHPGTDPDPGPVPPAERHVDVAGPDRRQFCWTHLHATQFNTPVR